MRGSLGTGESPEIGAASPWGLALSGRRRGGTYVLVRRDSLTPLEFSGLRIFDYTAGGELSSSLAVIEVPGGVRHAESWSKRSDKYYLVTAGQIRFERDGEKFDLGTGDFCLVRQGERFRYENPGVEPATLILVHTPSFDLNSEVFVDDDG
jgi:mannose-6-phosphate isomerase-like protein (cupin superfamily)